MRYLLLIFCILDTQAALYNTSLYTLGTNLVANHNFSLPVIPSGTAYTLYSSSISGWICTTICDVKNMPETCSASGISCNINFTKGIDFDTNSTLHSISQTVSFGTTGDYLLHIDWLPAFVNPIGKKFRIKINNTNVGTVTTSDSVYNTHTAEFLISANAGDSKLL